MTKRQLNLLFEYIDLTKGINTETSTIRMAKIKELLIKDARDPEIEILKIIHDEFKTIFNPR